MNTTKNEIIPQFFGESLVRTKIIGGSPWFAAKDICETLDISNSRDAISRLDNSEKITVANPDGNPRAGIPHEMSYVNESGMYGLVFRSRKKAAVQFRLWVTSEVLPSLRRHGFYGRREQAVMAFLTDLLRMGISAKDATRLTMASFPSLTAEERLAMDRASGMITSALHPLHEHILSIMEDGAEYAIGEIYRDLPAQAPFPRNLSAAAVKSRLGITLREMRSLGLISYRKATDRTRLYTRRDAKVVTFGATATR